MLQGVGVSTKEKLTLTEHRGGGAQSHCRRIVSTVRQLFPFHLRCCFRCLDEPLEPKILLSHACDDRPLEVRNKNVNYALRESGKRVHDYLTVTGINLAATKQFSVTAIVTTGEGTETWPFQRPPWYPQRLGRHSAGLDAHAPGST